MHAAALACLALKHPAQDVASFLHAMQRLCRHSGQMHPASVQTEQSAEKMRCSSMQTVQVPLCAWTLHCLSWQTWHWRGFSWPSSCAAHRFSQHLLHLASQWSLQGLWQWVHCSSR